MHFQLINVIEGQRSSTYRIAWAICKAQMISANVSSSQVVTGKIVKAVCGVANKQQQS